MSDASPSEPTLVDVDEVPTAVIQGVVDMAELAGFFDSSFGQLASAVAEQGVPIVGPAFALYHGMPAALADLEVGFPTGGSVEAAGDVVASRLPGGRVARLVHEGSYDELGSTWSRLSDWILVNGLTPDREMWEVYLTEPSPDMDPADLRTELNWPVLGAT